MPFVTRNRRAAVLVVAFGVGVLGCGDDSDSDDGGDDATEEDSTTTTGADGGNGDDDDGDRGDDGSTTTKPPRTGTGPGTTTVSRECEATGEVIVQEGAIALDGAEVSVTRGEEGGRASAYYEITFPEGSTSLAVLEGGAGVVALTLGETTYSNDGADPVEIAPDGSGASLEVDLVDPTTGGPGPHLVLDLTCEP